MDTKWNDMDNGPGTELDYYAAPLDKTTGTPLREGKPRSPGRVKPWVSFLCFFLGMTLVLSSVGETVSRIVWERDPFPRFTSDWQETDAFHLEVSDYLRDFLTIGVGGELDFYTSSYWMEDERYVTSGAGGGTAIVEENPGILEFFLITKPHEVEQQTTGWGYAQSSSRPAEPYRERAPDADYQTDKNILYSIFADKTEDREEKSYTNSDKFWTEWIKDPAYNFFLTFQNGKVTIRKDGVDLDVYGSGIYNSDSQWFVPGYSNFPVSEQLDGIEVHMAIRKDPICYYGVDYQAGNTYYSSGLYYIARQVELSRAFYQTQAVLLACGVVLLFVWFVLRKVRFAADRKIASWTVHIWTEARVLIGFVLLWTLVFETNWLSELYYSLRDGWYAWDSGYTLSETGAQILAAALYNVPGLLALFWLCWLLRNDHKHNPKEARRSLLRPFFRSLRARDLKRPLEKRVSRMEGISAFAVLFLEMEVIFFLVLHSVFYYNPLPSWSLWTLFLLPVLVAAAITVYHVRRQCQIAEDIGRLADQVESVRAGDLSKPLILPEDADLRRTADSLNDIQAGMKAALAEQTRSERMKVELVSNVSHDLKTPLTSILSYAELLRQEDLPPAAADYARIIDEKAQRLKTMVQDVFEVSKAAADQLPVRLERLDLGKLLRQTLADMDGPIQASALTFKVDVPESPVMITADGKRLYRVFQNLIDNALRYALEGSRVYLSLKTAGGNAEASMRNTSRSELPEGVDFTARFVRGDASRTDGGSGLGLSIASSFTEACGGEFRVETVADLFTAIVTFPLAEGE